jgi:phage terminase small subunit
MENTARKLTQRQRRFADLYLELGNASEAAEQAGFKRSYAQGAKKQPAVQAYMADRLREAQDKNIASADEVLSFLTDVMRGVYDGEKPEKNSSPRMKAAELLGKRLGVFNDVNSVLREELPVLVDDIPEAAE